MKKNRIEKGTVGKAAISKAWRAPSQADSNVAVFAALGDRTRLTLVEALRHGCPRSISQLTAETHLSRQAVTKHLRILESAGVIGSIKTGRESQFEFEPASIEELIEFLQRLGVPPI